MTGHDRGARICHRLAVDNGDGAGLQDFLIRGTILLDIVPTLTQWDTFKRSTSAVGHFHWPLLANVDFATELIKAQGGDKFCRSLIDRWAGKTPEGLRSLKENGALKVYGDFFAQASVIRASCQDYRAGAEEDVEEQKLDQNSRDARIGCPTLVIYSSEYLGSHYDVEKVWSTWVRDTAKLRVAGIKGSGHFIAEEAPVPTAALINDFWLENARSSLTPQQQDVRS
ncbi:MAG: hypothetical protein M1818_007122 [Claussenomyces sp. TS43310]|nr:MAG: hypothetical protein M1818_007122 [Claussenomyces sp. TS43310]